MSRQAPGGGRVSAMDGKAPEATDFANYFCTYAYLYHQVRAGESCFVTPSLRLPGWRRSMRLGGAKGQARGRE